MENYTRMLCLTNFSFPDLDIIELGQRIGYAFIAVMLYSRVVYLKQILALTVIRTAAITNHLHMLHLSAYYVSKLARISDAHVVPQLLLAYDSTIFS